MEKSENLANISLLLLQVLSTVPSCLVPVVVSGAGVEQGPLPSSTDPGVAALLCASVKWRFCYFLLFILFRASQFLFLCWEELSVMCRHVLSCLSGLPGGQSWPVPFLVLTCHSSFPAHLADSFLHFDPTCTKIKLSWFLAWLTFKGMSLCSFTLIYQF